ncbi:hypothetical protein JR316_0004331 [Psilocybe cubensis]|uniref:DnaJ homologue subfamily C member 28 conserved domain-containing protein n=2 Tax=Psilocybe cubensis TaxID=181762 RepID=A0A8H7XXN9_PSICU|nr:hypothetical protein JR316_0004331 [Psilocybe cubensis]KAH9482233.1 hypothetical protein JR316_0004331 [Psilocybe cubensis]
MQPICPGLRTTAAHQLPFSTLSRLSFSSSNPYTYVYARSLPLRSWRNNHTSAPSPAQPPPSGLSGSAKLFADAQREEAEDARAAKAAANKPSRLAHLEQEHENWTGDESIKDAVLRMLVDKYKPLRTGTIQTAEQKLKQAPPKLSSVASGALPFESVDDGMSGGIEVQGSDATSLPPVKLTPTTGSWATEPLLPSSEGHQPWHTEFKAPKHDTAAIKLAQMPLMVSSKPTTVSPPLDDKARRLEREKIKRTRQATKLSEARESTLDYKLGIKTTGAPRAGRINPISLKGWNSLVEDKIEKARKAGVFNTVQGRGKPLARSAAEFNPFIAREEFLMNRVVQKNGAAPPWVELQVELENAVNTFREILRQSWIRRATRGLAMNHPAEILHRLTIKDIQNYRDPEWIAKEKSYHETAVAQLNSTVRKYNGLAPYAVRRSYYNRESEIGRLYDDCAPDILRAIEERAKEITLDPTASSGGVGSSGAVAGSQTGNDSGSYFLGILPLIQWIRALFRRWFGVGA